MNGFENFKYKDKKPIDVDENESAEGSMKTEGGLSYVCHYPAACRGAPCRRGHRGTLGSPSVE